MTDPAALARRLSPAQAKALMWLAGPSHQAGWLPETARPVAATHMQLIGRDDLGKRSIKIALADWVALQPYRSTCPTPQQIFGLSTLGLAVRAELVRREAGNGG